MPRLSSLLFYACLALTLTQCSQSRLQQSDDRVASPQTGDDLDFPFEADSQQESQSTSRLEIDPELADEEERGFVALFQDMFYPKDDQSYIDAVLEMSGVLAFLKLAIQMLATDVDQIKTQISGGNQKFHIVESKGTNEDGGSVAAGVWTARQLNNVRFDLGGNILSITNGDIQIKAGKYLCEASAPAFYVNRHQIRIFNVTGNSVVGHGSSEYSGASGGVGFQTRSEIEFYLNLSQDTSIRLQHRAQTARATNGWGVKTELAGAESVYASLSCERF